MLNNEWLTFINILFIIPRFIEFFNLCYWMKQTTGTKFKTNIGIDVDLWRLSYLTKCKALLSQIILIILVAFCKMKKKIGLTRSTSSILNSNNTQLFGFNRILPLLILRSKSWGIDRFCTKFFIASFSMRSYSDTRLVRLLFGWFHFKILFLSRVLVRSQQS